MVAYCCVKGCNNNSSHKKKDPNDMTSFHAFPSNIEMKQKWLKAIGRPEWVPPSYSRVCSGHFSYDQINHDGRRIRIKDDAVPVKDLPANSNFAASDVEVCRFCLAGDLRLYSLQDGVHNVYMDSIMAYNENFNIEGLPQFICYECAAHLKKCYNLLEMGLTVQATLLDIFAQNGKITTNLIKLKNRKELNLTSKLTKHKIKTDYEFKYRDELEDIHVTDMEGKFDDYIIPKLEVTNIAINPEVFEENENREAILEKSKDNITENCSVLFDEGFDNSTDFSSEDEVKHEPESNVAEKEIKPEKVRNTDKSSSLEGLTPNEVNMEKYFNIVRLTLDEQIEEWKKREIDKQYSGTPLTCEICSKKFAHHTTYKMHVQSHDPSRGNVECPVCKLRLKNEVLAKSHANRAHAKKFYCKLCPKAFSNVGVAKKHHLWHAGHLYRCTSCTFRTSHVSALHAHVRAAHAACTCARCGRAFGSKRGLRLHEGTVHRQTTDSPVSPECNLMYQCEQCGLDFKSEGARRVHILTSKAHKKKNSLCDPTPQDPSLKNTCNKCGVEFPSLKALIEHGRAEHRRAKQKTSWRLPGDKYPTECEHCEMVVSNRSEHWRHVRREHPDRRAGYRAVVTAVCHTCGKGFQVVMYTCRRSVSSQSEHWRHVRREHPDRRAGYRAVVTAVCHTCGKGFQVVMYTCRRSVSSRSEHWRHVRREHPDRRAGYRAVVTAVCHTCGKGFQVVMYSCRRSVSSRSEHWRHVRREHPDRRAGYRAVVTAVCHTCGKGFQVVMYTCRRSVSSRSEHWRHVRREHPDRRAGYRAVVTAVCHTCGKGFQVVMYTCRRSVSSRSEHWRHVRREHPDRRAGYRAVVTAVCHTCGKGFQVVMYTCRRSVSSRSEHWRHVRREHPDRRAGYRAVVTAVCHTCGKGFQVVMYTCRRSVSSRSEHWRHVRREHPDQRAGYRAVVTAVCHTCGKGFQVVMYTCRRSVSSRSEHWRHVRREHPDRRAGYRAVVTAVCHTCGKGFQNVTKLHLHTLRHAPPSVPCPRCPRVFHDKHALARHGAVHEPARPHRCARCPRAFKQPGNLERHYRVHTGVTPYECSMCGKKFKYSTSMNLHVRTVHYKLPHPPRKRKKLDDSDGYRK